MKDNAPTVEGIGGHVVAGHYIVQAPKVLEGEDRTVSVSGSLEIPRENVLYRQVIG
jgi:hypothetical protein